MRILFLGDIVGEKALDIVIANLAQLKKEYNINLVIANAENIHGGKGLNKSQYLKCQKAGISALTMGNHTYSKKDIFDFIENANIVKPANLPLCPGKEYLTIRYNDKTITIISLLGMVFMNQMCDNPFTTLEYLLEDIDSDYIIVDFHAEATSEKQALAYCFRDKVDAVLGTHTHVQTADEKILDRAMYISDVGMCGPYDSVIGSDISTIVDRFRTGLYSPSKLGTGPTIVNGVVLDMDKRKIERINKIYNG